MVWLLDQEYDRNHRAFHMTETGTDLHPLKIRYHGTADMPYDERYTEFIQPTGLLPFITLHPQIEDHGNEIRAPAGAPFAWIRTNFGKLLPEGAERDTIRTYTRVYLWYMLSRTLFADSGGKLAHWCWLKALTVLERRWSWGTAALAYLYRQLDEACRRTGSGGIGGCLLLLSVWSWDRLSVGRPRILTARPWPHYRHNLDREPTWAYLWDNVSEMTSDPNIMYMHYTEELDTLTAEQCPPQWQDTDHALHSNYLQWFHESTRIELVKPAYDDDILYDPIEFNELAFLRTTPS
ncbi:protein MAINTENANCE OF MERISTEMS-like [Lolium rigidum]|uniref:protein MAINTENANCE OF MERISTEMS-like n=1 Tax=Lolium rigidum TaxID=89674 RepID=UPI001F5DF5BB|nr:protein MAINTENANCE OF MERISTEMS-like [Lolium rigidum]